MKDLEMLFQQTQHDYSLIPDFIAQLLKSDVYCIGSTNHNNEIQFRVFETPDGDQAIPFFLKLESIHQDLGNHIGYILLNTQKLFEMTQGATLILNPTSELNKVFHPEEIQTILALAENEVNEDH